MNVRSDRTLAALNDRLLDRCDVLKIERDAAYARIEQLEDESWPLSDRRVAELVAASQALQPGGCCAAPSWRGHLCQYHDGYRDGLWASAKTEAPDDTTHTFAAVPFSDDQTGACDHPRAERHHLGGGRRLCGRCRTVLPAEAATPEPEPA